MNEATEEEVQRVVRMMLKYSPDGQKRRSKKQNKTVPMAMFLDDDLGED